MVYIVLKIFLNSPQAQETAQRIYKQKQWSYIKNFAPKYDGTTINGIPITQSGMLAATHLLGQTRLQEYLQSNGNIVKKDGYGTSIEEYLQKFAGYDVSEITGLKNEDVAVQAPPPPVQANTRPAIITNPTKTYTYDFDTPYKLQVEKNDYLPSFGDIPFADPVNPHIFTPEEIGNMTRDEFERNLLIIEQQLKDGLIKPQSEQPKDYSSYKNPETGTDKIYTREDISKMSTKEYSKNEKEIFAQMKSVGIPYKNDLPANVKTHEKEKSYSASSSNSDGK